VKPNFCPVCGLVNIVPIMCAFTHRASGGPAEPAVLAYKCDRGHLFAFSDQNPCENTNARRLTRRRKLRATERLCARPFQH
jgi:hypothetical protein